MKKTESKTVKSSSKKKTLKPGREGLLERLEEHDVSKEILKAFSAVKPEIFFDTLFKDKFYGDETFPIMFGQKSDNFHLLGLMLHHLSPQKGQRILEIGTGTGYSSALLSLLCREVITIDINEKLALSAKERLYQNNFGNIRFFAGDGTISEDDFGSVDGIIIHAACRKRPLTAMKSLAFGGKMVFPMGPAHLQQIVVMYNIPEASGLGNFKMEFFEEGIFSLIKGPYGYDQETLPTEFFETVIDADEKEPPKTLESDPFLFTPNTEDD